MDQRLTLVTLGVSDHQRAKDFYMQKFGWKPFKELEGATFFKLNGILLSLFPSEELAKDAQVKNDGAGFKSFSLALNMRSEKEVDELFEELKVKGVKIVKAPEKVFWGGYSGYVADLDGNLWEIAFNPFLEMDEKGDVVSHE